MIRNVSEYLDMSVKKYPEKKAFVDERRAITFREIQEEAYHIATELFEIKVRRQPIIVFLDKSVECVCAFMGVVKSGNFYSPIDIHMPIARIVKIVETLNPCAIITASDYVDIAKDFSGKSKILVYEDMMGNDVKIKEVDAVAQQILDSDLLYVLFTSGSTGVPKGVMISERGVIDFAEWATDYFGIDDTYVFGNQTPFYFSFSIYEIYLTLKNGATTYIVPHEYFSYPGELMEYLYKNKINTIIWVPSALCMVSAFRALHSPFLPELKNVWFGAEVMPVKQLNKWIAAYPDVRFYNLFGPTEVTDTCSAYKIERVIDESESLPIGTACANKEIILLNSENKIASEKEIGEICVRGSGISYGYYNDSKRTAEVFVQNPLNTVYSEIIYRTGDLAKYNERGELVYVSRKDFQIKHMGQRIELGEIETVVSALDGIERCCCLYDTGKSRIFLFYTGAVEKSELIYEVKAVAS